MHNTAQMRRAISGAKAIWDLALERTADGDLYDQFPRDLESPTVYGLEIPIVFLTNLSIRDAANYLCVLEGDVVEVGDEADTRSLYGLLHVGPPTNVIFVRASLPRQVMNYVLAHELGHFMADVFSLRQLWLATMPEQKEAIHQAFTWQNLDAQLELAAVIKGLPSRPKTIAGRGKAMAHSTTEREIQADLIARELLAPWKTVSAVFQPEPQKMIPLLRQQFGLPWRIAVQYFHDLQRCLIRQPDTIDRLFGPLMPSQRHNPRRR